MQRLLFNMELRWLRINSRRWMQYIGLIATAKSCSVLQVGVVYRSGIWRGRGAIGQTVLGNAEQGRAEQSRAEQSESEKSQQAATHYSLVMSLKLVRPTTAFPKQPVLSELRQWCPSEA
jgi:hypothetical protein